MSDQDNFKEIIVVSDDSGWVWGTIRGALEASSQTYMKIPSSTRMRDNWHRFRDATRIIVHWEGEARGGGAVVEELRQVDPTVDIADRLIVVTTRPVRSDVVHFSELGIRRVIKVRQRNKDMIKAHVELVQHLTSDPDKSEIERGWRKVQRFLDTLPAKPTPEMLDKVEATVETLGLREIKKSARYFEALGKISMERGDFEMAERLWHAGLDRNPNYYRIHQSLVKLYRATERPKKALRLLQKMHSLNLSSVQRLVAIGEVWAELQDFERAEHYFHSALERDRKCDTALNGLGEIRFLQGRLNESRDILAQSTTAYRTSVRLNRRGISLVQSERYEDALDHYTKAQYVLPQQEKSPMLFFNMGLCYAKWGKFQDAEEYLNIALIKQPDYKKAQVLLNKIKTISNQNPMAA